MDPTNIHSEIPLMQGKRQDRGKRGNPIFLLLLDFWAYYLSSFFFLLWLESETVADYVKFGLKQNPGINILLKRWFSVQRKGMSSNTSLLTLSFDSSKADKHIRFCMKSQVKTTGLFRKPVFGLGVFCSFLLSPSTCTLYVKALVCHLFKKTQLWY